MAFAGPTPPEALGLALKQGLIPSQGLADHGQEWFEAWISGLEERFIQSQDVDHRPWRRACGAGHMTRYQNAVLPPRLKDLRGFGSEHPDLGLVRVFEGMLSQGLDPYAKLKTLSHLGGDGLSACIALNLPSAIDLLAEQERRPTVDQLNERRAPENVLGQRIALPWLHAAAAGWQDTLLDSLLDYGLDPNLADSKGQTPLFHARTERAVKALIKAGAKPLAKDEMGRTAAQVWALARQDSFPSEQKIEGMTAALGDLAPTPEDQQAALVRHIGKSPSHPGKIQEWIDDLPKTDAAMHESRLTSSGVWRGAWSPAAWLGLQILQGNTYHLYQLPFLLEHPDFIPPHDNSPRGKLTEMGMLGLGLAYAFGNSEPGRWGNTGQGRERSLGDAYKVMVDRWGKDWFWQEPWAQGIEQTSKALLTPKSTSRQIRDAVESSWLNQFEIGQGQADPLRGQRLWEARASGAVRMVHQRWEGITSGIPHQLAIPILMVGLGDKIESEERESKGQSFDLDSFVNQGSFASPWHRLKIMIRVSGGNMDPPDDQLDSAIEKTLADLANTSLDLQDFNLFKARALDKNLPAALKGVNKTRF